MIYKIEKSPLKIKVISFDYNGCLFHNVGNIIEINQKFLEEIKKENAGYDKVIIFIGSDCQSKKRDGKNSKSDSCFPAMQTIAQFLEATLDPFLLADLYGDLPDGTSYARAMDKNYKEEHHDWEFDECKITVLYAQMHKIANEYPNAEISFDFYDGKPLLVYLNKALKEYSYAFPHNITPQLYYYTGTNRSLKYSRPRERV